METLAKIPKCWPCVPGPWPRPLTFRPVNSVMGISWLVFVMFDFIYYSCFHHCLVSTSASDWPERLVSEMTYSVLMGTLNPTHSLAVRISMCRNVRLLCCLICCGLFHTPWTAGRAPAYKKPSVRILIIWIWVELCSSSWRHRHFHHLLQQQNPECFDILVPACPGCSGKLAWPAECRCFWIDGTTIRRRD